METKVVFVDLDIDCIERSSCVKVNRDLEQCKLLSVGMNDRLRIHERSIITENHCWVQTVIENTNSL